MGLSTSVYIGPFYRITGEKEIQELSEFMRKDSSENYITLDEENGMDEGELIILPNKGDAGKFVDMESYGIVQHGKATWGSVFELEELMGEDLMKIIRSFKIKYCYPDHGVIIFLS